MADPVVGITNGVPTSGTGTITTLGQTLLDGANATIGITTGAAVTTSASGTLQQYLRGIVSLLVSGITVLSHAVTNSGTFAVQNTAATPAGTNVIGHVIVDTAPTTAVTAATLPLPTGAATAALQPTNAAIGSTTSGQTGHLEMGAVTTGAPTYTTAQTAPLSLDTAGNLRAVITNANANGRALPGGSAPVVLNSMTYTAIAASQTAALFGATGATGDYLDGVLIVPATAAAGTVTITDGSGSAISIFAGGGTTALPTLAPFYVPIGAISKNGTGGWKVTTGANVSVIGVGNFT